MKVWSRGRFGLLLILGGLAGCAQSDFSRTIWNPFGLELSFDITKQPVRVGMVNTHQGFLAPENWLIVRKAPPYAKLRDALAKQLDRGIQISQLEPFQIAAHLHSGRLQYAFLSEEDYRTMIEDGPVGRVLGRGVAWERGGLIVAAASSSIHTLDDLRGQRFAFGPKGDAVLDVAALEALAEGGIQKGDLQKELLPIIPNADGLQYHISSMEAAKEIVYGLGTSAGVIERADYDAFPDSGGRVFPLRFAKDQFRVLGRTRLIRSDTPLAGPAVASLEADPDTTNQVIEFLTTAEETCPRALHEIGLGRFDMQPNDGPSPARPEEERPRQAAAEAPAAP